MHGVQPKASQRLWFLSRPPREHRPGRTSCMRLCLNQYIISFSECSVAKVLYGTLCQKCSMLTLGMILNLLRDGGSVTEKKNSSILNTNAAASLWCLWKIGNSMCFQGQVWRKNEGFRGENNGTLAGSCCANRKPWKRWTKVIGAW
jgi:hypothetical protein